MTEHNESHLKFAILRQINIGTQAFLQNANIIVIYMIDERNYYTTDTPFLYSVI